MWMLRCRCSAPYLRASPKGDLFLARIRRTQTTFRSAFDFPPQQTLAICARRSTSSDPTSLHSGWACARLLSLPLSDRVTRGRRVSIVLADPRHFRIPPLLIQYQPPSTMAPSIPHRSKSPAWGYSARRLVLMVDPPSVGIGVSR
jgi:hypothetical protein